MNDSNVPKPAPQLELEDQAASLRSVLEGSTECSIVGNQLDTRSEDTRLQLRVLAEFVEMPGLKLTLSQASRLFNLEPVRCERVLHALVGTGVIRRADGSFLRGSSA